MRKQKSLTEKQIQELLKSKYIEKVFQNRIIYTNEAGIDLDIVGRKNAVNLLLKWSKEGIKSNEQISLEKQIEELKAQNAYLKAENEFLKKLR